LSTQLLQPRFSSFATLSFTGELRLRHREALLVLGERVLFLAQFLLPLGELLIGQPTLLPRGLQFLRCFLELGASRRGRSLKLPTSFFGLGEQLLLALLQFGTSLVRCGRGLGDLSGACRPISERAR